MICIRVMTGLLILFLGAGCATFKAAGEVQSGRRALLSNQPEEALAYFQQAAHRDPDYIYRSAGFPESVWTYLGRAQYALGRWSEARRSFERALAVYPEDPLAKLYFGLALLQSGDERQGREYLRQGLRSLSEWIDYLNYTAPGYAHWDPRGEIRAEITDALNRIGAETTDGQKELLASAEWIGRQMEEEIGKVRRERQRRLFEREHHFPRGLSFGAGIGF